MAIFNSYVSLFSYVSSCYVDRSYRSKFLYPNSHRWEAQKTSPELRAPVALGAKRGQGRVLLPEPRGVLHSMVGESLV